MLQFLRERRLFKPCLNVIFAYLQFWNRVLFSFSSSFSSSLDAATALVSCDRLEEILCVHFSVLPSL